MNKILTNNFDFGSNTRNSPKETSYNKEFGEWVIFIKHFNNINYFIIVRKKIHHMADEIEVSQNPV